MNSPRIVTKLIDVKYSKCFVYLPVLLFLSFATEAFAQLENHKIVSEEKLQFKSVEKEVPVVNDLTRSYKVLGECATQNDKGEWEECEAWNTLELIKLNNNSRYSFVLETNTFATTQGGCYLDGELSLEYRDGENYLVPVGLQQDGCHFRLHLTEKEFLLEVPESEIYDACKSPCGPNSTLYSDPFPRVPVDSVITEKKLR